MQALETDLSSYKVTIAGEFDTLKGDLDDVESESQVRDTGIQNSIDAAIVRI